MNVLEHSSSASRVDEGAPNGKAGMLSRSVFEGLAAVGGTRVWCMWGDWRGVGAGGKLGK